MPIEQKVNFVGGVKNISDLHETVERYTDYFKKEGKDALKQRKEQHTSMTNDYYNLVTDLYEYGWGKSFHFAPRAEGESLASSILRQEMYIALQLKLEKGMQALDLGCGIAGPLMAIAKNTEASITGLNINEYQITRGQRHINQAKLGDHCKIIKADFKKIPLPSQSVDAVYCIEAMCHVSDKHAAFGEIFRVLKPGGRFVSQEWVMTSKFDPNNSEHCKVKLGIEEGNSIADLTSDLELLETAKDVGFQLLLNNDRAIGSDIPWYQPLRGGDFTIHGLRSSAVVRKLSEWGIRSLEMLRVSPKGLKETVRVLNLAADSLVAGGEMGIFTPLCCLTFLKPAREMKKIQN